MSLGRWTYVAFVLVLAYCVNICFKTFDVTGVTNVATDVLVGNLRTRSSAYALCAFGALDE
jgi:hypothetical protein